VGVWEFVGEVVGDNNAVWFAVGRILPSYSMVSQVFQNGPERKTV